MSQEYELSFENRPAYLYAKVRAQHVDEDTARSYLSEIAEHCRGSHCSRLMIYRDIPEVLHGGALFFVASEFESQMHGGRVAFVNPYAQNLDDLEFGNLISSNRGGAYQTFPNESDAEDWLLL
jgi:hypothetical protein